MQFPLGGVFPLLDYFRWEVIPTGGTTPAEDNFCWETISAWRLLLLSDHSCWVIISAGGQPLLGDHLCWVRGWGGGRGAAPRVARVTREWSAVSRTWGMEGWKQSTVLRVEESAKRSVTHSRSGSAGLRISVGGAQFCVLERGARSPTPWERSAPPRTSESGTR